MRKKRQNTLSRRSFWKITGALAGSQALLGSAAARGVSEIVEDYGGPSAPANEIVLFPFDDFSIPLRYRLQIGLVSASNPYQLNTQKVLECGKPGSPDEQIQFYGSVLRVDGELRMWYPGYSKKDELWRVCYATSKDGVAWEKPSLGLMEFAGSTKNNLVDFPGFRGQSCLVLYEPEEPNPDRRFKMAYEVSPFDIGAAFSPGGLHWKDSPHNPILKHNSLEPGGLAKFNGCYYLNGQGGNIGGKRPFVTNVSYDFDNWTDAVAVGLRRDLPPNRQGTGAHAGEQVHTGGALWNRGNVVVGAYGQWHGNSNDRRFVTIDIGLVVSNDAMHFREPIPDFQLISSDEAVVPEDQETAVPGSKLGAGQAFENIGDKTLLWYAPWAGGYIWLATWLRDRLGYFQPIGHSNPSPEHLALQAARSTAGTDITKLIPSNVTPHFISCPLRVSGPNMRIFMNAAGLSDESTLSVELLDEKFTPLPGYSGDECVPVTKAGLREPVMWRNKQTIDKFDGAFRVKVRWMGKRPEEAYVYALYISDKEQA